MESYMLTNASSKSYESTKDEEEEESAKNNLFSRLKPYCLELIDLAQNTRKDSNGIPALLQLIRTTPSALLQPFFDYTLFPLLLLLDAAVHCRGQQKDDSDERFHLYDVPKTPYKVSDKVAEGVIQCLEELLKKCNLGSVDQMVMILKKLTNAALLIPSEAAEEFREGVIKCFRALILSLLPCSSLSCSCKCSFRLPALSESRGFQTTLASPSKYDAEPGECLLAFLQSQTASVAVGHWLSLLLKAAATEAKRGHRGSANLRIEAFKTLRVLVAAVGSADALAFFLPGVVSQFAQVLFMSKTMISGAAGSVEAIDQALRGLAEYLMIVLHDDTNSSALDVSIGISTSRHASVDSFMEQLRCLPSKAQSHSKAVAENTIDEAGNIFIKNSECSKEKSSAFVKEMGSLHLDRTKEWIEETARHVNKLLCATFPHICVHAAKKVRQGLLAAVKGLLSKCAHTMADSRLMLLECLCVLVADDADEVSLAAQEFLEYLFFMSRESHIENDLTNIFNRLIEKLPKVVLRSEEALALSHAQQLFVVIYYSGPQFVMNHLQSPITAARFLDVFALCLSQNSAFAGSLDKLIVRRPSSMGYLRSIAELKDGSRVTSDCQTNINGASLNSTKSTYILESKVQCPRGTSKDNYDLPRMPPWFAYVGSQKLYQALAGSLRLVGLSFMTDFRTEGQLSVIADIPLGYFRKLVSEIRVKEYNREDWQTWHARTGSGQLVRQASTAACILNEMIFGVSNKAADTFTRMFHKSKTKEEDLQQFDTGFTGDPWYECSEKLMWKVSGGKVAKSHLIDIIGKILHEYQSLEVWDLPIDHKSSVRINGEVGDITLHFFRDTALLHQVIIEGIGIFSLSLGEDFVTSGFLHSSLYLLLENLICSNFQVRSASDAVLQLLAATSGHPTVGHLILANSDYIIDSICRQLRHLDLNPHVPNVLASMLSYIGVAHEILPLLEEPMHFVVQELEILGRHEHPDLTLPFLKAVAEIAKASKHEACSLPAQAESNSIHVKVKASDVMKHGPGTSSVFHDSSNMSGVGPVEWETLLLKLNDSRRYRRTVGSIAGSCLKAATPLLASLEQAACLVALDIVVDGICTLAKVEEAYRKEVEAKEAIEEVIELCSLYQLKDTMDTAADGTDENRLLPAMNKIWPFLVVCVQSRKPVVVRRCLSVISTVVQVCGGDFFSRRFHTDGPLFWKLLTTSPFQRKPKLKEQRTPLQLPYRSISISPEESLAEVSDLKVQVAVLNMIADLSQNKKSASALKVVLKKVSGIVMGIACSGVLGLRAASINALQGLSSIDLDLIWILLADVYYSFKKKDLPLPPTSDLPELSQVLPPPPTPKGFLYLEYGGQSYGFDVDFTSVEAVFEKMNSLVFSDQIYY